jgi:hypothetical protein
MTMPNASAARRLVSLTARIVALFFGILAEGARPSVNRYRTSS